VHKVSILLTGPNGFLGSHILEALLLHGYQVTILKRSNSDLWRIHSLIDKVKSYDVDTQGIELAFREIKIDCVIHTACSYGRNQTSISEIAESNMLFGLRIIDACIKFDIKTFISTDSFFNNKKLNQNYLSAYTLSKKQFEEWLLHISEKIQIINLNLHHMYGPKDDASKFIPWIVSQFKDNVPEIKLSSGRQQRDFIYVADVVSAYLKILEKKSLLENYNKFDVGTGEIRTLESFLKELKFLFKKKYPKSVTELVFGGVPDRDGEILEVEVDNSALMKLGWTPKTLLNDALKQIIDD
jgi:CDP-paratose synthetase